MDKVAIVIPSWNGRHHLERCLPSLLAQDYPDFEILLVDNASTDDTVDWVRQHYPQIRLIWNQENYGFARAVNIGIRATETPFVVTLNNDTVVDGAWLGNLVATAGAEPAVGMVASKVLYMQPPHLVDSAGADVDRAGFYWNRYNGMKDKPEEIEPYEVFGACASAALYRRQMLDEIGLFDHRFFAYCEDMDLAWRGRLMGWRCVYVPLARVYHAHSATSGQGSAFKRFLTSRNRIWTVVKNYHSPDFWLQLPRLVFYDLLSAVFRVAQERSLSPITGRLASLGRLPHYWRKRHAIQHGRRVTSAYLNRALAPFPNIVDLIVGRSRRPHRVQR